MDKELVIKAKTEQLLYKIYSRLMNFPKSEKFSLAQRIKEAFFDILKFINLGNAVKSKRKVYLQEADAHLQTLKVLIKLANNRKYISSGFFKEIDLKLTEINQLLSEYIKSTIK